MRVERLIALVTVLAGLVLAAAPAAAGASRGPAPERADLITHVFPETGQRVVAVALRYDEPLQLRRGSAAARTAFAVRAITATCDGVTVYRSTTLPGDAGAGRRSGRT